MNNYGISTKLVGVIINQDTVYRIIKIILAAKKKCNTVTFFRQNEN